MRKTLIALFLAAAVPAAAIAMPGGSHHHGHGDHGPRGFHELNLSQEQKQQIHELMGKQFKTQREITKRYLDKLPAAEQKAMQDEIKAAREAQQKGVRSVLTAEQQKTFDQQKEKRAARHAERQEFLKWKAEQKKD